jgi:hypothetical protein
MAGDKQKTQTADMHHKKIKQPTESRQPSANSQANRHSNTRLKMRTHMYTQNMPTQIVLTPTQSRFLDLTV